MKRYYVCKIIGDGLEPETAFRPAIADIVDPATGQKAYSYSVVISSDAQGRPLHDWCLVIAAGRNHALAAGKPDIDVMPDFPLDGKVSAINNAVRTAMFTRLSARGIDVSDISNADGYRDLIRGLGRKQDPNFHENNFDVADD